MTNTVAAFDFDGTIAKGDAVVPFCALAGGRERAAKAMLRNVRLAASVKAGRGDRNEMKRRFVRETLGGLSFEHVDRVGRQFADRLVASKLWPDVMKKVEWHREQGHDLVIVSASLDLYLQHAASSLGFDAALCTTVEVRNGTLTGELEGENVRAEEKARRLSTHVEPGATIWSYGNSRDDFAMFEMSAHPFFVDKDGGLAPWYAPARQP